MQTTASRTRMITVAIPDDDRSEQHVLKYAQMLRLNGVGAGVLSVSLPLGLPEAVIPDAVRKINDFLTREAAAQAVLQESPHHGR